MSNDLTPPSPDRFGLSSFAELLSARPPILGEEPHTYEGFRDGLMRALTPFTPYECVVAENLVAIEWELYQQRRMREAALRKELYGTVHRALMAQERFRHEVALDAAWEAHAAAGGDADDWEEDEFDEYAATARARDLAARATSEDPDTQADAEADLAQMGLSTVSLMSEAYAKRSGAAARHDEKLQELERRRREVKRDYDALQKTRPVEAEVADAEVIEG